MDSENVQIARAVLDAMNRDDLTAAFERTAPDFEVDFSRAVGMDRGIYTPDEFRTVVEEFSASWESFHYHADEFFEAGEHVMTPFTNHLRGRGGIEVEARGFFVWTIRDGVIVRLCLYQERHDALAAIGLRE